MAKQQKLHKDKPAKKSKPGMDIFATRDRANEGVKLDLCTPEGENSEHWLQVLGIDSDAFQKAQGERSQKIVKFAMMNDGPEKDEKLLVATCELMAVVVVDWSFSDKAIMKDKPTYKCTPKNVVEFLVDAPQIRDQIDRLISKRSLFFAAQKNGS